MEYVLTELEDQIGTTIFNHDAHRNALSKDLIEVFLAGSSGCARQRSAPSFCVRAGEPRFGPRVTTSASFPKRALIRWPIPTPSSASSEPLSTFPRRSLA
jgi:hypothetical protein